MHLSLNVAAPAFAPIGKPVMIPVYLNGALEGDDVRGVQFTIKVSDTTILAPQHGQEPQIGTFFPNASYTDADPTEDGWSFILNTPSTAASVKGSGMVVKLPFYGRRAGCVSITFDIHKLRTSRIDQINHFTWGDTVCLRDKGVVSGNLYLEARSPGQYGGVQVALEGARDTQSTTADMNGFFQFDRVDAGDYTLILKQNLYVQRRYPVTINDVETVAVQDVGLWGGDLNRNRAVTRGDWRICAAASRPVNDPAFDITLDGMTDVSDCTVVRNNVGRDNMDRTNPPRDGYTLPVLLSDADAQAITNRHLASTQRRAEAIWSGYSNMQQKDTIESVQLEPDGESDLLVRLAKPTDATAIGLRIEVPMGATATSVALQGDFANAFSSWHQDGQVLYIIAALPDALDGEQRGRYRSHSWAE